MNPELLNACELRWSKDRTVTRVQGPTQAVFALAPDTVVGRPLHEVLGVPEAKAAVIDARARQEAQPVEFVSARSGPDQTVLRISTARDGEEVVAAVVDAHAFLQGAPPLQISRLSSSLSHEIRNPLSSVKMAVQTLARNTGLTERDQRRLTIANREIRTMERMLGLLSEYGRDVTPSREPAPLRALIQDALALVEQEITERGIRVEIEEPPEVLRTRVDPHRLRLVLAQFLLNVAMGLGEEAVLRVSLRPGPEDTALMVVTDEAASVPPEERATLFEPFGSRLARGAGLSLAALRRVMQLQGGDVSVEGLADQGALFTLTFPS